MQCVNHRLPATKERVSEHGDGLESVKKTHQVAGVGRGRHLIGSMTGITLFAEPG
jgi:hypothetical protein